MPEKNKYSSEDVFNKWAKYISSEDKADRYAHNRREAYLEDLCAMLKEYDIEFEDAKSLKHRVMIILTTEEGRKGKGAHKGWKETVFDQFDQVLADYYVENTGAGVVDAHTFTQTSQYIEDEDIMEWVANRFGEKCPADLISKAHTVGHQLNILFLEETYVN
jgi:hypothetical protein